MSDKDFKDIPDKDAAKPRDDNPYLNDADYRARVEKRPDLSETYHASAFRDQPDRGESESQDYNDRRNPDQPGAPINPPFGAKQAVVDARGSNADELGRGERIGSQDPRTSALFDSQNVNAQIDLLRHHVRALYAQTGPVPEVLRAPNDMGWDEAERKRIESRR